MKIQMLVFVVAAQVLAYSASAAENLKDRVAKARDGQTITLPAGEFTGGVTLPDGVSLKGAGVGKTIVTGGLTIKGGRGAQVSDLTLQGLGLAVSDAESVTVARVRATGAPNGFLMRNVTKGRIENCISDHNSFGIAVSGGADCVVVNCTIADCPDTGLALAAGSNTVAFNNCIVGTATCLNIDVPTGLHVDHNLYFGVFLGQMREQTPKRLPSAWQFLTGLDRHSVQMPGTFDASYAPTSVLPWALDRATTGDWGVSEFAGVKAPTTDLLGQPRKGRPDVGAFEVTVKAPRAPDGKFTVANDAGIKSAGAFTKDGFLIAYLFQGLPLPKGQYSFWLPTRDYVNQPIKAGEYEVRLTESDFQWKHIGHIGDTGEARPLAHSASRNPSFVMIAPNGLLLMQQRLSEDHAGVRAYDVKTGKLRWHTRGSMVGQGIVVGQDGIVYSTLESDAGKGVSRLTRLNLETGDVIPWPESANGHEFITTAPGARSLAIVGDRLYLAGGAANKLFVITTADGKVEKTLDVPAPKSVAGDEKTKLLWVVSGSSIVAMNTDGTKLAESSPVPEPAALAVRAGKLAVASTQTGKIHFFDVSNPQDLKRVKEFGKGDGPFGAFAPDRFWFQKKGHWKKDDDLIVSVSLGPNGNFAVNDHARVLMFDGAGQNLWYTLSVYGNQSQPSYSTQNRRFWDSLCDWSFLLDENNGTWQPEAFWDHWSELPPATTQYYMPLGDFSDGGKTFLVTVSGTSGLKPGTAGLPMLIVSRLEDFKSVPVLVVTAEGGKAVKREDSNGDGKITAEDAGEVLTDATGKPLPVPLFQRFNYLEADGSICAMTSTPMIWKRTGLSAKGVPVYEGENYASFLPKEWNQELSPYDFKPNYTDVYGSPGFVAGNPLSDGSRIMQVPLRSSGGWGWNNAAGTDLVGYAPDGRRRWVHQLAPHKGLSGLGTADDITMTAVFYCCETITVDADGLALGGFCEPAENYYIGYWIDHANLRMWKLPDGKLHVTWGDNGSGRHQWFRLDKQESLKKSKHAFRVSDDRAKELAALEWKPSATTMKIPQPEVRIPQLAQPFPIDGDLEKWRQAGVKPVAVIGPGAAFDGPGDCSAVIRMAYEGQNLYFQVLQFDDIPIFYSMVYEDCVELAINGACGPGYQFLCFKTADGKDHVWRNRFFAGGSQMFIDAAHAPRIIKVLPDAQNVPERIALENLYGVDLSKAKVVVTEFKLPIDKHTWKGSEGDIFPLGPGKTFWIGFFIDDNDTPYTDVQSLINWPPTFSMFDSQESGARVICE